MIRYLVALVVALMATVGGSRDAQAQEHGAFALGFYGTGEASATAWAFDHGDSAAEAQDAADMRCRELLGEVTDGYGLCRTWRTSFANSCYAVAVGECLEGCVRPAYGVAGGSSRNEASTAAIAMCENAASSGGAAGTCRVATSDQGEPGVVCVGDAAGGTVETAASPGAGSSAEWGALAFGLKKHNRDVSDDAALWAWAFDYGDSKAAARDAAWRRCNDLFGGFVCEMYVRSFANSCAAIAVSECPSGGSSGLCRWPAHGFAGGGTGQEAATEAIAACESAARQHAAGGGVDVSGTCRVATSDQGEPGVVCVGDAAGGTVETAASPAASSAEWGAVDYVLSNFEYGWVFEFGDSAAAARTAASDRCRGLLDKPCSGFPYTFANTCFAIAVSEMGEYGAAFGLQDGSTERDASTAAIAHCERGAASVEDIRGTCRVATSDQGEPGVVCVGDAR